MINVNASSKHFIYVVNGVSSSFLTDLYDELKTFHGKSCLIETNYMSLSDIKLTFKIVFFPRYYFSNFFFAKIWSDACRFHFLMHKFAHLRLIKFNNRKTCRETVRKERASEIK